MIGYNLVLVTLVVILLCTSTVDGRKKCRALVLEGGGDMGSYQAGVLKAFAEFMDKEEIKYDIVTGVSVGSINSMALALHEIGNETAAIKWMVDMWGKLAKSDIYTNWPLGIPQGLLFKEGIWNNGYELEFLNKSFHSLGDPEIKRKLEISTVDFDSGKTVKYNETLDIKKMPYAVKASTSMPFAFTHTHFDNHTYVDGGSIWNVDISGAIERCLAEEVSSPKDVVVDIILCSSVQNITKSDYKNYNTMQNYWRYQSIQTFYDSASDWDEIMRGYPDVNFRHLLYPLHDLPTGFLPLNFDHDSMEQMIEIGYEEAKEQILNSTISAREKVARLQKLSQLTYTSS